MKLDYWPKPLPTREFDWSATSDDYEPGMPVGYGATCEEAIADLEEQMENYGSISNTAFR